MTAFQTAFELILATSFQGGFLAGDPTLKEKWLKLYNDKYLPECKTALEKLVEEALDTDDWKDIERTVIKDAGMFLSKL